MIDIFCTECTKKKLFGAIIGLARSAEGNKNRPTESTNNALLLGLRMFNSNMEYSHEEINTHIEVLHTEKFKLVKRCLRCNNPCGRNDDYDVYNLEELELEIREWKYTLLFSIMSMESLLRNIEANKNYYEEVIVFLYDALFILGAQCDEIKVQHILIDGGRIYKKIFTEYLNGCK